MIHRALPCLLLLLTPALAQEGAPTYDLRQAYAPKVGDRVRVELRDEARNAYRVFQGGQPVQEQDETVGRELAYTDDALRVQGEDVLDFRRTYARFRDLSREQPTDVTGLVVTVTEDAEGTSSWKAGEGVTVPPEIAATLDEEVGESSAEQDQRERLLSEQPVAVGQSWELELPFVAEMFSIEPADLVTEASSARGTLKAVETVDGLTYRVVLLSIDLTANRFNGMRCPQPIVVKVEVELRLSPQAPFGHSHMRGTVAGQAIPPDAPPGVLVELHTTLDRREVRTPAPK